MGRMLGEAWVTISPETAAFRAKLIAEVNKAIAGMSADVPITGNIKGLTPAIAKAKAEFAALQKAANIDLRLKAVSGLATLEDMKKRAVELQVLLREMPADIKDSAGQAKLAGLIAQSSALRKILNSLKGNVDLDKARAQVLAFQAQVERQIGTIEIPLALRDPDLAKQVADIREKAAAYMKALPGLPVDIEDKAAVATLLKLQAQGLAFVKTLSGIKTDVEAAKAMATLAAMDAAATAFRTKLEKPVDVASRFDLTMANVALNRLDDQAKSLGKDIDRALTGHGSAAADLTRNGTTDLKNMREVLVPLQSQIKDIRDKGIVSPDDITRVREITGNVDQLSRAVSGTGAAVRSTTGPFATWVGFFNRNVPLFGGMFHNALPGILSSIKMWHLLLDVGIEAIAVWVPAAVALGTFAAAAMFAGKQVVNQAKMMNTAMDATGQTFKGLGNIGTLTFANLAKPYVYQAFGMGMLGMQHQASTTATVIQKVGTTLDRTIAQMVIAWQHASGKLAMTGTKDLALLIDSFKQLGTIINAFMRVTPGYAEVLLKIGDAFLHVVSAILNSKIGQIVLGVGLAFHGAYMWIGLFTTALSWLGRVTGVTAVLTKVSSAVQNFGGSMQSTADKFATGGEGIATTMAGTAEKTGNYSRVIKTTLGDMEVVGRSRFQMLADTGAIAMDGLKTGVQTAAKGIRGAMESMGINPYVAAFIALGAATYFIVNALTRATTGANSFGQAAGDALNKVPMSQFSANLKLQLEGATKYYDSYLNRIAGLNNKYSQATGSRNAPGSAAAQAAGITGLTALTQSKALGQPASEWKAVIDDLNRKNAVFNSNIQNMAKTLGVSVPQAMNLATQAGLTNTQMATDQGVAWKEDMLQVQGAQLGYARMTYSIGGANTALSALAVANSSVMSSTQQVTAAYAGFVTLITGGQTAFDTFMQGQATLASNLKNTGAATTSFTLRLGKLTDPIKAAGYALNGTSQASIAANQAFSQQITNAETLFGNMMQLSTASGNTKIAQAQLAQAGKDLVASLLPTAQGSKAATTQLYALAQTMGYAGNNSVAGMTKWLGKYTLSNMKAGTTTKDLKMRLDGLTGSAANLTHAATALAENMSSQLTTAINQSIVAAEGGTRGFAAFSKALLAYRNDPTAQHLKAVTVQAKAIASQLILTTGSTDQARQMFVAWAHALGLSQKQAVALFNAVTSGGNGLPVLAQKVDANRKTFLGWAQQVGVSRDQAATLWGKLGANNFDMLHDKLSKSKDMFFHWAAQVGLSKGQADNLWNDLQQREYFDILNGKISVNKKHFFDLAQQMGDTKWQAQVLWAELKKAPNVTAGVNIKASGSGAMKAYATAGGGTAKAAASQQLIGAFHFASGGKLPGFHNTGDNIMAFSPGGPVMLQGGEAVVPKHLASRPAFSSWAKANGIPGFSQGGSIAHGPQLLEGLGTAWGAYKSGEISAQQKAAGEMGTAFGEGAINAMRTAWGGGAGGSMGGSATGSSILHDAERFQGHPYRWGGPSNPQGGWDCSSFVGYILGHDFNMPLPGGVQWSGGVHGPVASDYNNMPGFHLVSHNTSDIRPGDLLVENSGGHVGFGVGPNRMFSAYGTAFGTIFSDAANMTNIYRDGAVSAVPQGSGMSKSGIPIVDAMASIVQRDLQNSPGLASLFPALGGAYTGNPLGGATGTNMQNGRELYNYLLTNLFGGSQIAAAGATASIWGESSWNPFSVGTGGRGLIGWTPPSSISDAAFQGGMATQLPAIIDFVRRNGDMGVIAQMQRESNVTSAAWDWDRGVERAGVSDVHSTGLSLASSFMGSGAPNLGSAIIGAHTAPHHFMGGKIPGFAKGGKVKGHGSRAHRSGFDNVLAHLIWEKNQARAAETFYSKRMNFDLDHNLAREYFIDSGKFQHETATLASLKAQIRRRKAMDKMTPLQRSELIARQADNNLISAQNAAQGDYAQVQALGGRLLRDKHGSTAWKADKILYDKALETYLRAGKLERKRQHTFNLDERIVNKLGGPSHGPGAKLKLDPVHNQVDKLVDKLTVNPLLSWLIGAGSTSALGWALQPVLGQMMIANVFNPRNWLGKSASDGQALSVRTNYYNAQQAVRQYMNGRDNHGSMKLAGAKTGIHGKDSQGRKFFAGGYITERVEGIGMSTGMPYTFGEAGKVEKVTPMGTPGSSGDSETNQLLRALLTAVSQGNSIAQQQPLQYARALNQNAGRRIPR